MSCSLLVDMLNTADSPSINNFESQKQRNCVDCHTTTTSLWRGGPSGPGSLCNACGIRYRKRRSGDFVNNNGKGKGNKRRKLGKRNGANYYNNLMNLRVVGFGREMAMRNIIRVRGKVGEEEEKAAMLLMALSYGYL